MSTTDPAAAELADYLHEWTLTCRRTGIRRTDRDAALFVSDGGLLDRIRAEARAAALWEAADAWLQGEWADTPRHADRVADRIGNAQHFGDWLRKRAEESR